DHGQARVRPAPRPADGTRVVLELRPEVHAHDLAAEDAGQERVERERRLRDHDARARRDGDEQERLDQLVRAVAGEDAVRAASRGAGQGLHQLAGIELGITRPRPRERLLEDLALQLLRQIVRVLVLVDLDGSRSRGEGVRLERADRGLHVAHGVGHGVAHASSLVSTLWAWPGKPSARATWTTSSATRRKPRAVSRTRLCGRSKSRPESGDGCRAGPPVGSTWFGPMP